jgi:hypothetical protein
MTMLATACLAITGCECLNNSCTDIASPKQDKVPVMPFEVSVGGQKAVVKGNATYGEIPKAVNANAEISVGIADTKNKIFINMFQCDKNGKLLNTEDEAIVIIIDKGNKTLIRNRMNKGVVTELPAGYYIMNVVAGGKTSRVLFKLEKLPAPL